jgi:hypothetical protein
MALLGEGVNPNIDSESSSHRVAWNRLPAMLAVDVWREYASKFMFDEFFNQTQAIPTPAPKSQEPTYEEIAAMDNPSQVASSPSRREGMMDRLLRDLNNTIERSINTLEMRPASKPNNGSASTSPVTQASSMNTTVTSNKTALQIINEMVKARLTQPRVDIMDEYGKRLARQAASKEYELLQRRGLKVISVSISNVRLHPTVQESLIKQWKANWLKLAKGEGELLDIKRNLIETAAQEKAQFTYALHLSREIDAVCTNGKTTADGLLKSILLRSRAMIRSGEFSTSLRRRMITELQDIDDTIRWLGEDET